MAAEPRDRPPPEVRCQGLAKTYGDAGGALMALSTTDLVFEAGRTTALVGPSGCGKSTLLRLIAGLESPTTGSVEIGGESPLAVRKRAGLAMAFQDASLLPWRTVRGNVALALQLGRMPSDGEAVDRLISLVGLDGFEDSRPSQLSGGMRQRAAIARCLVTEPGLLLLDEPFGAVDELTRLRLNQDLPRLWEKRGTTTILVTHSITEAVLLSDRVLVFSARPGRVVADIPVALPRPRSRDSLEHPRFRMITDQVSAALMEGWQADAAQ
ncbi:NitT/TauT family transport system ATP-binding protein [Devosia enhydra]|uniref:NitT/TauT family transport system ATP-binding protein n=1 Tax=Devosia enhydra TaxID=665118 RepID=A0A1K2I0E8_9HYPH|nr:ABC transporter ATP-binding protein [Devosia enhydra]SFZ85675.1 NitT/TauT family transport system ATP-binding protein [Devosia enhydra]